MKSLTMYGSPIVSSTPGGIEIGVRPSLDCCDVDAEKCRRAGVAGGALASAGTRKQGIVMVGEAPRAAAALALLGPSMVVCACDYDGRFAALVVATSRSAMGDESFRRAQKLQDALLM